MLALCMVVLGQHMLDTFCVIFGTRGVSATHVEMYFVSSLSKVGFGHRMLC